jgi:hypothetical protein
MSAPPPHDHPRPDWLVHLDRFVLDIHRSGFVHSLILHLVVLLSLATLCLGTNPAARRTAFVVAFEGSGAEAVEEGSLELAVAAAADGEQAAVAIDFRAEVVDQAPLAADVTLDGLPAEQADVGMEAGAVLAADVDSGAGIGRKAGAGTGAGAATFFGVEAAGEEFVYVVDFSGSMEGSRIEQARYELRRSIESLPESASFFIILFNDGGMPMPAADLVQATAANRTRFLDWVDRQPVGGGTNPIDSLVAAARLKPDAVFILTDGQFVDPQAAIRLVARSKGPKFHAVAFQDNSGEGVLRRIARAGRGTYRFHP